MQDAVHEYNLAARAARAARDEAVQTAADLLDVATAAARADYQQALYYAARTFRDRMQEAEDTYQHDAAGGEGPPPF